jgi:hypothetical protein
VKKILSILLALGVILGLTITALPVAAQVDCPADCTPITIDDVHPLAPPDFCAGDVSNYFLGDPAIPPVTDIILPVSLVAEADWLVVDFPAGTDLTDVDALDVTVYSAWYAVSANPSSVMVNDAQLAFMVPIAFFPALPALDVITIQVDDVINTDTPGDYCLYVGYMFDCCDVIQFDCVEYTVNPPICTLDIVFDFSPTYLGLAEGFVPPFKACGQDGYGHLEAVGWATDFDLNIVDVVPGCHPPCASAELYFVLTKCPEGETITFDDGNNPTWTLTDADIGDEHTIVAAVALPDPCAAVGPYPMWLHFSSPGKYEICFYLECPAVTCGPGEKIVAQECMPCSVYQWKEAVKIPLFRKWNLISLPLVPLVDPPIEDVMGAYAYFDTDVMSIWYYDRCEDEWLVYPAGYPGGDAELTTMEDGKAYWVRIKYDALNPPGTLLDGLWVWGTPKPTPPLGPSAYEVCEGWNMVGLTGYETGAWGWGFPVFDDIYLWNWWSVFMMPEYSGLYGWDPTFQTWYSLIPWGNLLPDLYDGQGYWIAFEHDGFIYPP